MSTTRFFPAAAGVVLAALSACGPGNVATQIRTDAPTAGSVMNDDHGGGSCTGVDKPLIVDADVSLRGDIEDAMKKGIAIVAYDCKKIRLLACKAPGDYSYAGFTTKQETVKLENADEIKANLPLSGASMAAKLEGELTKGITLDIAMALVGKKSSTAEVSQHVLSGPDCKEATHFVRGAMLGAFAMQTGSKAQVKAAAEIFTAKAGASSASGLQIDKKEGVLEECLKATPDDVKPRNQCAGLIRLELVALGQHQETGGAGGDESKPPEPEAVTHACPAGLTWDGTKCAIPSSAQTHACKAGDLPDCSAQCDKGNADSCNTLGVIYQNGAKDVPRDSAKAEAAYLSACNRGIAAACGNVAALYRYGAKDVAKSVDSFKKYAQQGCNMGDGKSCATLAGAYFAGDSNDERIKSGPLYVKACNAGYAQGCFELGYKIQGPDRERFGHSFLGYQPAGIVFLGKACKAGLDYACASTGDSYAGGLGTDKDGLKALELYTVACDRGSPAGCYRAGHLYEHGLLTKDEKKAADFYKKACEMKASDGKPAYGSAKGCLYYGRMLERGAGVTKDEVMAASMYKKSCDTDDRSVGGDGCVDLARIYESGKGVPKNPARAADILVHGCNAYASTACYALGSRYLSGQGLPKDEKRDEKKAVTSYTRACGSSPDACVALASMSLKGTGGLSKDDKAVTSYWLHGCALASVHDVDIDASTPIAQACAKAGAALADGKGTVKDPARAYEDFTRACNRGDKASCDQAKKIGPPPAKK